MRIPLNLGQNWLADSSEDALKRVQLHIHMAGLTGGRGFRQQGKNSTPSRIERISQVYFNDEA